MRVRATSLFVVSVLLLSLLGGGSAFASRRARGGEQDSSDRLETPAAVKRLPALLLPETPDALSRALSQGHISAARYALERVRSLFDVTAVRDRFGPVDRPHARSATILMRDLLIRLDQLSQADRATARRILARPTDMAGDPEGDGYSVAEATPVCDPDVCVHFVPTTDDAPPMADTEGVAGVPDHVEAVSGVLANVWTAEIDQMGYRPPKSDLTSANNGGSARLDIYLADIGDDGLFGYCSSDDPNALPPFTYDFYDVSAFCVLDNDYAFAQFGYDDPMDPLRVTAAHEFFHAVHAAYDWYEDGWLLESTATWIEDEIFDDVNDNLLYLPFSPLANPLVPIDKSVAPRWYGTWIFWRFLTEYLGGSSPDPSIVLDVWERADGAPGGPDKYSTQAMAQAVSAQVIDGTEWRFRWAFADFAVWNARPAKYYDEGASYTTAAVAKTVTLTRAAPSTRSTAKLDHLSNRFVAVRRSSTLKATAKLRVTVDGPGYVTGPEASVVVIRKSGKAGYKIVNLNSAGNGAVTVPFGSTVARVVVIMTNASTRYRDCYQDITPYACFGGVPLDQNRTYSFRAAVV
jgi:hypothetical protein